MAEATAAWERDLEVARRAAAAVPAQPSPPPPPGLVSFTCEEALAAFLGCLRLTKTPETPLPDLAAAFARDYPGQAAPKDLRARICRHFGRGVKDSTFSKRPGGSTYTLAVTLALKPPQCE